MRAVAARVTQASVQVGGVVVGAIEGPGLLVLLGVHRDDSAAAADVMA
ncbi:MAG: D-aminoacyl-tRNA deacylase, partial [Pseudonocardiales bacterium]|nr:D-aminoacyl-tRNA deacylase [Pseudonocardiales bacterium]